jgi:hypothetical protein
MYLSQAAFGRRYERKSRKAGLHSQASSPTEGDIYQL